MKLQSIAVGTLPVVLMCLGASVALGQSYPSRTVRLVTSEVGGGTDFAARQMAQGLAGPLGQPVIVENRAGGGSVSGMIVTHAEPDGHTLIVTGSSFWVGPLFRKSSYDPIKGFTPISLLVNSPNILVVPASSQIKTVKDLIDLAKAKPGVLNYASSAVGSSVYLGAELFKSMAGVNIMHVPYKGSGPALIGVVAGEVQLMFATSASVAPHLKSGKLRAVAVTSVRPSILYPDLPTVASTVPGYDSGSATAMLAPPKTPAAIIGKLSREVMRVLNQPEVKERFLSVGVETVGSTPEQLASAMKSEMARLGKVVKDAGLRVE